MTVMTEIRKRSTTESFLKAFAKSKAVKTLANFTGFIVLIQ